MAYWLMKTEPSSFSIDDLKREQTSAWDGVRNYEARNNMQDMKQGDLVVIYHSSCTPPGAAGTAKVVKEAYPDPTQFNPDSDYHDPKATKEEPRWFHVDVAFVDKWPQILPLSAIKKLSALQNSPLTQKGSRLSVMPLTQDEYSSLIQAGSSS